MELLVEGYGSTKNTPNGYGTQAFFMKIEYAFEKLVLRRMGNDQSEKMQKKLGFRNEGIRRKRFLCLATNEYVDECITGLLSEEFVEPDKITV